jgi:hypothetical protein
VVIFYHTANKILRRHGYFMQKKSLNDKLASNGDLPKIIKVEQKKSEGKDSSVKTMLVAPASEYDQVMRRIPKGKLITSDEIRTFLAKKYSADYTCQLTAGIFINIVANASEERKAQGSSDLTPYWRTLKKYGQLNEKYPGGVQTQKNLLESEGHEVIQKGRKFFVKDYKKALYIL